MRIKIICLVSLSLVVKQVSSMTSQKANSLQLDHEYDDPLGHLRLLQSEQKQDTQDVLGQDEDDEEGQNQDGTDEQDEDNQEGQLDFVLDGVDIKSDDAPQLVFSNLFKVLQDNQNGVGKNINRRLKKKKRNLNKNKSIQTQNTFNGNGGGISNFAKFFQSLYGYSDNGQSDGNSGLEPWLNILDPLGLRYSFGGKTDQTKTTGGISQQFKNSFKFLDPLGIISLLKDFFSPDKFRLFVQIAKRFFAGKMM